MCAWLLFLDISIKWTRWLHHLHVAVVTPEMRVLPNSPRRSRRKRKRAVAKQAIKLNAKRLKGGRKRDDTRPTLSIQLPLKTGQLFFMGRRNFALKNFQKKFFHRIQKNRSGKWIPHPTSPKTHPNSKNSRRYVEKTEGWAFISRTQFIYCV